MVAAAPPDTDQVTAYALAVGEGEIVTGRLVQLACRRHLDDLDHGHERGLRFDHDLAAHTIDFFGFLPHSKGDWAGKPFILEGWERFIIGCGFGWRCATHHCDCGEWIVVSSLETLRVPECGACGAPATMISETEIVWRRRFRIVFVEVARKNGKSTLAAGTGLKLAFFDDEDGAEVYAAATKRDQAKVVWSEARRMVLKSPPLRSRIRVLIGNLHAEATNSKFEPLGADKDGMDGLNTHGAVIDELHAHKTRAMWDVIEESTAARRQPMLFVITTAGMNRNTICWEQHEYAVNVLEGVYDDDSYFAYIATIDLEDGDDWRDPACWPKANPNLGVSVKLDYLQQKCERAKRSPGAVNSFLQKHLNVWTESFGHEYDMEIWDLGQEPIDADELLGRTCYAGLDLARVRDVTAWLMLFPPESPDEKVKVLCRFWIPADDIRARSEDDHVPYDVWQREGFVTSTPGNTTDFDFVAADILEDAGRFNISEIAIDRTFAGEIIQNLTNEGLTIVPFGQGFLSMVAPVAEVERLVISEELQHGGHPVLRWMASNVVTQMDAAGNKKMDKERSREKIDGMVALAMAVGRYQVHTGEEPAEPRFSTL